MLDLTAAAEVDGVRFDGFDIFLYHPHFNIDGGEDEIQRLADKARARNLMVGTVVAPVYAGTGGGSPMGSDADRRRFLDQVRKACRVAQRLRELGVKRGDKVRIDSACSVEAWCDRPRAEPAAHRRHLPRGLPHRRGPRRAPGRRRGNLLGRHAQLEAHGPTAGNGRPAAERSASRPTCRTRSCTCWATTRPEDALLPQDFDWRDRRALRRGLPARSPRRCGPGRSTSTSPRTTARCTAPARTTRPAATACPPTPTASSTSRATPAIGSATSGGQLTKTIRPSLLGRLHVPQRRDDEAARPGTTSSAR